MHNGKQHRISSDSCFSAYIDLFEKTVSAIRMNIDGGISLVLKNGNIIGKGETNGNDHNNDTA